MSEEKEEKTWAEYCSECCAGASWTPNDLCPGCDCATLDLIEEEDVEEEWCECEEEEEEGW
jgi:hypothetical protein